MQKGSATQNDYEQLFKDLKNYIIIHNASIEFEQEFITSICSEFNLIPQKKLQY